MDRKLKTAVQIVILFVLPIVLLYFDIISIRYRFFVLLAVTFITIGIAIAEKLSLKDFGIRFDNIKKSVLPYLILTVFAVVVILVVAQILGNATQDISGNIHFQYGFIILSFLQEFLFRSFLIPKLKILTTSPTLVVISNTILFGFLHIIYPNTFTIFILAAILGIGFASVYYFRPNLILATIAHSIINFIAVFYCFASFNAGC